MVKDHSVRDKNPLLPLHGVLFLINFYMHNPTDRIAHTSTSINTSHGALAGMRNSSMSPPWEIDPTTHHCIISKCFTTELHLTPWLELGLAINNNMIHGWAVTGTGPQGAFYTSGPCCSHIPLLDRPNIIWQYIHSQTYKPEKNLPRWTFIFKFDGAWSSAVETACEDHHPNAAQLLYQSMTKPAVTTCKRNAHTFDNILPFTVVLKNSNVFLFCSLSGGFPLGLSVCLSVCMYVRT